MRREIFKIVAGNGALRVFNLILVFFSGVLLARMLGPNNYGVYSFIFALVNILILPTQSGLPTLLVREVSKYRFSDEWGFIKGLVISSNAFIFLLSLLIVVFSLVIIYFTYGFEHADVSYYLLALVLIPILSLGAARAAILRGLNKVVQSSVPELLVKPAILTSILIFIFFTQRELEVGEALQYSIFSTFVAFVLGAFLLVKELPKDKLKCPAKYSLKKWGTTLIPLAIIGGVNILNGQISIFVLGLLSTKEQVGLYSIALKFSELVSFGIIAVNLAIGPTIVKLNQGGNKEQLRQVFRFCALLMFLVALPIVLFYFIFGVWFLNFVLGQNYSEAYTPLIILSVGNLFSVLSGCSALALNMLGYEKENMKGVIIAVVTNCLLLFSLVPLFGSVGAALSFSLSVGVWKIYLIYKVKSMTGFNCTLLDSEHIKVRVK